MYTCCAENLIATKELLSCKKVKGRTEAPSTTDFERSVSVFVRQRDRQQAAVTRAVVKRKPDFVF
jgi:hypothetical protein